MKSNSVLWKIQQIMQRILKMQQIFLLPKYIKLTCRVFFACAHSLFEAWVSNLWPVSHIQLARLYYVACGHICKSCIHYKNYTIIWVVTFTVIFHMQPTTQPSIMDMAIHIKGWRPTV
jgi:hypothetical protein